MPAEKTQKVFLLGAIINLYIPLPQTSESNDLPKL